MDSLDMDYTAWTMDYMDMDYTAHSVSPSPRKLAAVPISLFIIGRQGHQSVSSLSLSRAVGQIIGDR